MRDPLGLNKIFWAPDGEGTALFAARPRRLIDAGCRFADIKAIPPGAVIDATPSRREVELSSIRPIHWFSRAEDGRVSIEGAARTIRSRLMGYLTAIAAAHPSAEAVVCLSGGLDSSGIAALAREVFPDLVAASFDLKRRSKRPSDDRNAAQQLARDLHIPLVEATYSEAEMLEPLDLVLTEGIDWRDFNVHAALVNAALARTIASSSASPADSVIVLTGDLANEFLVDYQPEHYRGESYYRLPRLHPSALRTALIKGLETSHREVGVFQAWGLSTVQPYAVAVDTYLSLPESILGPYAGKAQLYREIFAKALPDYVYSRKKVRAQIGTADGGGVLASCIDRGIDGNWLRKRFGKLHGVEKLSELDRFIRAGQYRSGIPFTKDKER